MEAAAMGEEMTSIDFRESYMSLPWKLAKKSESVG